MKKIFFLIILIGITPFLYQRIYQSSKDTYKVQVLVDDFEKTSMGTISYQEIEYRYDFFTVDSPENIFFEINLDTKKTSSDIVVEQNCTYLINAGFYDKQDKPIGLVIKNNQIVSTNQKNNVFNGYVVASSSALRITSITPNITSGEKFAFQTGPLLVSEAMSQSLRIKNDKPKRRMIAVEDTQGKTYFMVIMGKESLYEGPLLADLPEVLGVIAEHVGMHIQNAINLDGGSASTFYSPENHIRELRTIGSYMCIR